MAATNGVKVEEGEVLDVDVLIVGGGPVGMAILCISPICRGNKSTY